MKHFYQDIQGWSAFLPLYEEMVKKAPQTGAVFVEVGAWKGRSAAFMGVEIVNSNKQIQFHIVDHFLGAAEQIKRQEPELVNRTLYEVFLNNMKPLYGQTMLKVHKMGSIEAAAKFVDKAVDFVLIDGSHDYVSVMADLNAWVPKVKAGGTIGGDDWTKPGVRQAVTEFFEHRSIQTFGGKGKSGFVKCWRMTI